jgi:hypothetical protein
MSILGSKPHRNTRVRLDFEAGTGYADKNNETIPESYVTRSIEDNIYVTGLIPATDHQYSWISASAVEDDRVYFPYGYATGSSDISIISSSEYTDPLSDERGYTTNFHVNLLRVDADLPLAEGVESFKAVAQHLDESSYTYKMNDYYTPSPTRTKVYFSRMSPYGFPSWRNVRVGEHPAARWLKENNRIFIHNAPRNLRVNSNGKAFSVTEKWNPTGTEYEEPPVSDKYLPVVHRLNTATNQIRYYSPTSLEYTHANHIGYFANKAIDDKLDIEKNIYLPYDSIKETYLGDDPELETVGSFASIKYSETIWPQEFNAFTGKTRNRPQFVFNWRDKRADRTQFSQSNAYNYVIPTSSMWPLDVAPDFLEASWAPFAAGAAAQPPGKVGELWGDGVYGPELTLESQYYTGSAVFAVPFDEKSATGRAYGGQTLTEMDGMTPFSDDIDKEVNDAKYLAKGYSMVPEFRISEHMDFYLNENNGNFLRENEGLFTITGSEIASSEDDEFYKTYSTSELFSEFGDILEEHEDEASPTRLELKAKAVLKFLPYEGFYPIERTVQLAGLFSESYKDFVSTQSTAVYGDKTYSSAKNKVFSQAFFSPGILYNSIKSGISVGFPTLTGSTIKKLGGVQIRQAYDESKDIYDRQVDGLLFRTTTATGFGTRPYKLPFESLIEPHKYLNNKILFDLSVNQSGNLNDTNLSKVNVLCGGRHKNNYSLSMHNFLASSISFFKENSNLSSLVSLPDNDPNHYYMSLNREYRMRVILRGCKNYNETEIFIRAAEAGKTGANSELGVNISNDNSVLIEAHFAMTRTASWDFTEPTFKMYDRPFFLNTELDGEASGSYMHGGSAFGWLNLEEARFDINEPSNTRVTVVYASSSYDCFTPAYYQGYAYADIIFKPFDEDGNIDKNDSDKRKRKFTLEQILNNITSSLYRYSSSPITDYYSRPENPSYLTVAPAGGGGSYLSSSNTKLEFHDCSYQIKQDISDSVKLDGVIRDKKIVFGEQGQIIQLEADNTSGDRWAIYPKWETPIFDYSSASPSLPVHFSQSVAKGVWHQYGSDLSGEDGLFIQVIDPPGQFWRFPDDTEVDGIEDVSSINIELTGSLAEVCGFNTEPIRVGGINNSFKIREAIVLVPYIKPTKENRNRFIKIDQKVYDDALPSSTIGRMKQAMRRYVIPPKFDFMTYDGTSGRRKIDPIAMYFFEFEHEFDREDLKRIWHNVKPKDILVESTVTIGHDFLDTELLTEYREDLRWLVFKVKQKADWNYYEKTLDSSDDQRFQFQFDVNDQFKNPDYSYNWPFDFCSLIEYAKLEASVLLEAPEEAQKRRSRFKPAKMFEKEIIEQIDIRDQLKRRSKILNSLNNRQQPNQPKGGDAVQALKNISSEKIVKAVQKANETKVEQSKLIPKAFKKKK